LHVDPVRPPGNSSRGDRFPRYIRVSQSPIVLPSLSVKYAKAPIWGIGVRGVTVVPPLASTFLSVSSIESTPIVITGDGVSLPRPVHPPLVAPGSVGRILSSIGTVVAVV